MNAIEPLVAEEPQTCECKLYHTRPTALDIPVKVTFDLKLKKWLISPDPIRVEYDEDTVCWDLTELMSTYNQPGTLFEIEFYSAPGPSPLIPALGPFQALGLKAGNVLVGQRHIYDCGCFGYNLYVTVPHGNREKVTIDPQVDNAAPPPHLWPLEAPGPEDSDRAEH